MITLSTMNSQSSENFEDSSEERVQFITNGEERFSADRELIETYDEQRRKSIFQRWYNVDFKGKFSFPEPFNTVPIHHLPDRIWIRPMDYDEVARRLLGESENDGPSQLPAEIIRYFADIVEFSSGNSRTCRHGSMTTSTIFKFWNGPRNARRLLIFSH